MRMDKGMPFMHVQEDGGSAPTFSEKFLYSRVGKGDARFMLGVAEEYEHVIDALGPTAVKSILDVKPRLARRLGLPEKVVEWLGDAVSDEFQRREEQRPSQAILDARAAHAVWEGLHDDYKRFYEPEKSMGDDRLRAYHALTDALGPWEQEQRQKEIDRLPEKLVKKAERVAARAEREQRVEDAKAALRAGDGVGDGDAFEKALQEYRWAVRAL